MLPARLSRVRNQNLRAKEPQKRQIAGKRTGERTTGLLVATSETHRRQQQRWRYGLAFF